MLLADGKLVPKGLDSGDPTRIRSSEHLVEFIETVGFMPLFAGELPGFSVEERTAGAGWWTGGADDPWAWRETIAQEGRIAYGKLFGKRAGFVSLAWYPLFATYRRDGYDFDSRYEDGLATYKTKAIMDLFETRDTLASYDIKALAGFGKDGRTGYETAITTLQMQTYLTVCGFERKRNKKGEPYGWPVGVFCKSEHRFGAALVRSAYTIPANEALEQLLAQAQSICPGHSRKAYLKELK